MDWFILKKKIRVRPVPKFGHENIIRICEPRLRLYFRTVWRSITSSYGRHFFNSIMCQYTSGKSFCSDFLFDSDRGTNKETPHLSFVISITLLAPHWFSITWLAPYILRRTTVSTSNKKGKATSQSRPKPIKLLKTIFDTLPSPKMIDFYFGEIVLV